MEGRNEVSKEGRKRGKEDRYVGMNEEMKDGRNEGREEEVHVGTKNNGVTLLKERRTSKGGGDNRIQIINYSGAYI